MTKESTRDELHKTIEEFKSRLDYVENEAKHWNTTDIQRLIDSLRRNMNLLSGGVTLVSKSMDSD